MSDDLADKLLMLGVVCVVAAIVGGGLKALGAELPLVKSLRRQVLLGAFGVFLIIPSQWEAITNLLHPPISETSGPTIIEPGQTKNITVNMPRKGEIGIVIKSLVQDLTAFAGDAAAPGANALFVRVCGHQEVGDCPSSQVGSGGSFSRDILKGEATVTIFSFGTSPRLTYVMEVRHPQ